MTALHYDSDFEIAAAVLEFEQRWIRPRGTVHRIRAVCTNWCPRET